MTGNYRSRTPVDAIEQPTQTIPVNCMCVWIVVRAGAGVHCVSRLKNMNALCPRFRDHEKHRIQAPPPDQFQFGVA